MRKIKQKFNTQNTEMDVSTLPDDVREKLAELELELSEGEFNFINMFRNI